MQAQRRVINVKYTSNKKARRGFKHKTKKAFTLVELSVVIAVTAILSLTVFSLVVSLNRFYYANEKNADIKDELTRTESFIKDWFNFFDTASYPQPAASQDGKTLEFSDYHLEYNGNTLAAYLPGGGEPGVITLKHIKDVSFEKPLPSKGLKNLIKCRLTYEINGRTMYFEIMLVKLSKVTGIG
jgi:prepilin-type N-terminal cleavage/methylation domain-containing protein